MVMNIVMMMTMMIIKNKNYIADNIMMVMLIEVL